MVELTFVLLLVMGGEKVEYTPYQSLSECLSVRRKIKRNVVSIITLIKNGRAKN